jgi:IS5 family transposase
VAQRSFADLEYGAKRRKTRRERFLEQMGALIPWERLEQRIAPHYPKGGVGRQPYPLGSMLRVHCLQLFYNLSDPGLEDALYEVESMRRFAGLSLARIPDETTILNFRHLLEKHALGRALFEEIKAHLAEHGLLLREGTIVDATILSAPSSTKNETRERDPEMHQTRKGGQWYFGMKLHIGVDDETGLVHSVHTTAANEADINVAEALLHGDEVRVWGDAGYQGIEQRAEHRDRQVAWWVALRAGKRAQLAANSAAARIERFKAQVRARVEHPFRYIKQGFGYSKVRYRGLAKNTNRLFVLAGFSNLLIARRQLAP